jgi:glutathione S-transferase
MRDLVVNRIVGRLALAERDMVGPYLTGETFTAADAYFFVIASWTRFYGLPLTALPRVEALISRVADRLCVRGALTAEGHGMVDPAAPIPQPWRVR